MVDGSAYPEALTVFYLQIFLIMIYKFLEGKTGVSLEVQRNEVNEVILTLADEQEYKWQEHIILNENQLYDLIGVLHSIQTKIKKGGYNEKLYTNK